jgi:hypothetical protein
LTIAAFSLGVAAHLAALAMLAIQIVVGVRALAWLRVSEPLSTHERILFGWAAGFSLTTTLWMLLSASGLLNAPSVLVVAAALVVVSSPTSRELLSKSLRVVRTVDMPTKVSVTLGIGALCLWAWPFWVETLLPNSDWDSALYHLPLAERYLAGSLWGADPYFPAFAFPGAVHLQYAALLALGFESAITPMNLHAMVLTLITTVALARQVGGRNAGLWASVAFTTTPILWQLGVDSRIDGFLSLSITLATYALVRFAGRGNDAYPLLAALCLGVAIGCKYSALPFVVAIGAALLGLRLWGESGARGLAGLLATGLLLLAVPNASWYVANAALHGDPLFPMLGGNYITGVAGERIPLARADEEERNAHLDTPAVRERLAALEAAPTTDAPGDLFDVVDVLRRPDRYAVKPNHRFGPLLLLSLALPLVLPGRPERRRGAWILWAIGWGGYAVLGSQTNLLRYVAPVLPILAAATGVLVTRVRVTGLRIVFALTAVALFVRDFDAERSKLSLLKPPLALGGEVSIWKDDRARVEWLKQVGYNFTPPMAYAAEQINGFLADGRMPADSLILMVGEGKGRLLHCDSLPDSSWFAHRFVAELRGAGLDHGELARNLREQGITHVLYNRGYYEWVVSDTTTARSRLAFALSHLERFLDRHGVRLYQGGGIELFALTDPAGRALRR